ncbi:unnamed protein product [Allacma fusca]|uniref:DUF4806 domain-containing protein n=1 Tax=Allacma fusca TaxID=39272 RepID=A0A8J2KFL8_9HEXA|nr:unnamed protein product [Allacma fusca]
MTLVYWECPTVFAIPISKNVELVMFFNQFLGSICDIIFVFFYQERYLASFGGKDLKKTVNSILSRVISDQLAAVTSFTGKGKGHIEFRKFIAVNQLLTRAARKNTVCKDEREADINSCIMDWLRFASDRITRRSHKKK